ncbi:MAG: N-acetyltransferase family protein [Methanoregula sp.]
MESCTFTPLSPADGKEVIDLFNYYIEHSFAAYPEQKVPYQFFEVFRQACTGYPSVVARTAAGSLAGFGLLRPYSPMPTFCHTAEITYFIRPELTGKGLGSRMLDHLQKKAEEQGITTILASISSLNEGSIRFHERHGFVECGRFLKVAEKKGFVFDTVWMQIFL